MNFIKDLLKKFNSKTNRDWAEIDNPIPFNVSADGQNITPNSDSIAIPADGNNEIFKKGGTVIPPRRSSGNKKYFFIN